ncbi:MAG: hypothetical protein VX788_00165, partial [Candidatus Thermoplasmatota archaeon]|nr:hypothetical protein [Candidatus Thermoplasmatota archaeon]
MEADGVGRPWRKRADDSRRSAAPKIGRSRLRLFPRSKKRKYDPTSGSDQNSPFAHPTLAVAPPGPAIAGDVAVTSILTYYQAQQATLTAVVGVVETTALEAEKVTMAVGNEAERVVRTTGTAMCGAIIVVFVASGWIVLKKMGVELHSPIRISFSIPRSPQTFWDGITTLFKDRVPDQLTLLNEEPIVPVRDARP